MESNHYLDQGDLAIQYQYANPIKTAPQTLLFNGQKQEPTNIKRKNFIVASRKTAGTLKGIGKRHGFKDLMNAITIVQEE